MNDVTVGLEAVLDSYYKTLGCRKCNLYRNRKNNDVLAGFGSSTADILILTDAPSMTDYDNRELLSDDNGRLFLNMLEMVWYEDDYEMDKIRDLYGEDYFYNLRDYLSKHIFFAPVAACPIQDKTKVADEEAKACRERIYDLIYAVDPLIIIGLGDVPRKHIFGVKQPTNKCRGAVYDIKVPSRFSDRIIRYPALSTHHPRVLGMVGDQNLVDQEKGLTYESLQDITKALTIVKTHKEMQND